MAGIRFNEAMTGGFVLGETDPEAGRRQGERTGSALTMHAQVAIDDIDLFLSDPGHNGTLGGTLDVPGWGQGIAATAGVFRLFSPSGQPRLKLMVYELAFAHGGRPYYLAGRKEVRDDPGFDLWRDTTTLFTRLHEGVDAGGTVVGAGTLALGVADLVRLMSTMRATGAADAAAAAAVLARFGRMFLGELWDSYGPHGRSGG
ncbi:hypothetical protein [Sphingomonas sanxanigenens]|uniref:Uncharacterized protein n=1 Tax=Sphingomonas sanxanigenens DSM 19645 = NX02 TaxID=1123269 RepID=W0A4Q7_9SPHN|nr:hypothetical protein [Sphingomonas sanxanigenens]AHE51991.1 hypothetical protein NX02_01125 [Sphingomonas sanxanigenens DSM 19645 = NX02]